jgi:hypothetical protein
VVVICLVSGFVLGVLVGVFMLPALTEPYGLRQSNFEIITVSAGDLQEHDFGDNHYVFYNNFPSIITNEYGPTVLELDGHYATIPMGGHLHTVLGLQVSVYEYNDDYVIYLARLA